MSAVVDAALGPDWTLELALLDAGEAARRRAVPARSADGRLWMLGAGDAPAGLLPMLESRLRRRVRWLRCPSTDVDGWLAQAAAGFRALDGVADAAADTAASESAPPRELSIENLSGQSSPAVRLLDAVVFDALKDGASDIHLESDPQGAQIRLRIDGVVLPMRRIDGSTLAEQVVSRLKVLAELDIGERRLPQDGRFRLRVGGRDVDFRVSIMPTVHGEDAVVRVLDRGALGAGGLTLEALGFEPSIAALLLAQARQPHGMLLVTGPTGSGKTTTLYAAITQTLSGRDKVVTIEDPVEYRLPGVVQIPVNDRKGLGFARGLRSILRHDPDRIMVGEIRDTETAQIAVQAALTGHLVFTTVHANGALDVIGRFMHMGLDLYNVVSALNVVAAQRLMRQTCVHCAGRGCERCRGTGYHGRRAIAELLRLDDELRDLIAARAPMSRIKELARERGMVPLREAAAAAVRAGWTTAEEFERVTLAD